jgi:phage protein D
MRRYNVNLISKLNVVRYQLIIGGEERNDIFPYLKSIEYTESESDSDKLSIVLEDPRMEFIQDNLIVVDKSVDLMMGWADDTKRISFQGWISLIDISFNESRVPTVTFHCMNTFHKLNKTSKQKTWKNARASTVVEAIARENGLIPSVTPTSTVEETISQSNETDATFLLSLASKEKDPPFVCYIKDGTLYFHPRRLSNDPQATLVYGKDGGVIESFSPRLIKEKIQIPITVKGVSTDTKKPTANTGKADTNKDNTGDRIPTGGGQYLPYTRENCEKRGIPWVDPNAGKVAPPAPKRK